MANPSYRVHTRRIRHARIRYARKLKAFLAEEQTDLNGTGAAATFTGAAGENITWTAHGKAVGDGPFLLTTTITLPAGLSLNQFYWIAAVVDVNTVKLSTRREAPIAVTMTDAGSGIHTITKASNLASMTEYLKQSGATILRNETDVDNL